MVRLTNTSHTADHHQHHRSTTRRPTTRRSTRPLSILVPLLLLAARTTVGVSAVRRSATLAAKPTFGPPSPSRRKVRKSRATFVGERSIDSPSVMSSNECAPILTTSNSDLENRSSSTKSSPTQSLLSRGGSTPTMSTSKPPAAVPDSVKLLFGAGGIYAAFLYYGSLQEDVFRYTSPSGEKFHAAWFLQVLEALANVVIGFVGMQFMGPTPGIPLTMFAISGASQVTAKACTSLALANGLSFPVATLAKSGKMAPVMAGSLLLGGASYSVREYLQVAAIVGGTAEVSMGKKKGGGGASSSLGVGYIVLSLVLDGVTAGFQKRLKKETAEAGVKPKPYDFMFWTNLFMCGTAFVTALVLGEFTSGFAFCAANPTILSAIVKFSLCSAVGQSFIFYTIANFDPLVLSTVTTTRKIFSVLLSIFLKGHALSAIGWSGIALACGGIASELQAKARANKGSNKKG